MHEERLVPPLYLNGNERPFSSERSDGGPGGNDGEAEVVGETLGAPYGHSLGGAQ